MSITLGKAYAIRQKLHQTASNRLNYSHCLAPFVDALNPRRHLNRISLDDVAGYIAAHYAHLKPSSRAQYICLLKAFFNWCVTAGYLSSSPLIGLPSYPRPTDDDSGAIPLDLLERMKVLSAHLAATGRWLHLRNHALLLLLCDTAARRGALEGIRISDLDLEQGEVWVKEKGSRHPPIFFTETTAAALRAYLARRPVCDHDVLFIGQIKGRPLQGEGMRLVVANLAQQCGGARYGTHAIRTLILQLFEDKFDLDTTQHKANHRSSRTTYQHYLKRQQDKQFERVKRATHELQAARVNEVVLPVAAGDGLPKIIAFKTLVKGLD